DLVEKLVGHSRKVGIDVHVNTTVQKIERAGKGIRVGTSAGTFEAAAAIHAAGRKPKLDALNLAAAGIDRAERGVKVNEFLQSPSNPRVYAAGDASASGPPLTPVAGYEGRIVAANLLQGNRERPNYEGVASTVFSLPPLASCGLTEETARARGLAFDVHSADTSGWYSSRRIAEPCSGYKVLIERGTGRILGAHILGTGAEEYINVFALAIRHGLTAEQIKAPLYAYPTHGSNTQYMVQ